MRGERCVAHCSGMLLSPEGMWGGAMKVIVSSPHLTDCTLLCARVASIGNPEIPGAGKGGAREGWASRVVGTSSASRADQA